MNYHQPSLMHEARINASENNDKSTPYDTRPYSENKPSITIIDRPCGTGKTTELLRSFQKDRHYVVVVPYLSEVERVIKDACVPFTQPSDAGAQTKSSHFEELLLAKANIVITHSLFTQLAYAGRKGLLEDHHVIVDEVLDVISQENFCSDESFEEVYVKGGFATVGDNGAVHPTLEWWQRHDELADTLSLRHFRMAQTRTLYRLPEGAFVRAMPLKLLTEAQSVTVYTYMAEGSMMVAYLKKEGAPYRIERWSGEADWVKQVASLVDVKGISALDKVPLSYAK